MDIIKINQMKKIFTILSCASLLFTACQLDNYPGPDAQIYGSILDAKTG